MDALSTIPIQNIYYLLCYAWDRLEDRDTLNLSSEDLRRVHDLLARVLVHGVNHTIRRGLYRGYVGVDEDLSRLRGRVDFAETMRRRLLCNGRAHCRFDELDHDILPNRIVKAALAALAKVKDLDSSVETEIAGVLRRLNGISDIPLNATAFRGIQRHRNLAIYDLLLHVSELVCRNLLVSENDGTVVFRDFLRDRTQMALLFENFVRNFYRKEQQRYEVKRENIQWHVSASTPAAEDLLPQMTTDISLLETGHRIVVECKFYEDVLSTHYGATKLRQDHLCQLVTYLGNLAPKYPQQKIEGILLYAQSGHPLELKYDALMGFPIRVVTIDLSEEWKSVHQRLLDTVGAA